MVDGHDALVEDISVSIRRLVVAAGTVLIGIYLVYLRGHVLADIEEQVALSKRPIISPVLDLSKSGTFQMNLPMNHWGSFAGNVECTLVIASRPGSYSYTASPLTLRLHAYAVMRNGTTYDRTVLNFRFSGDVVLPDRQMTRAVVSDEGVRVLLGEVTIYPGEATTVVLEVVEPQPALATYRPTLELSVPTLQKGLWGPYLLTKAVRDSGAAISLLVLVAINFLLWRR